MEADLVIIGRIWKIECEGKIVVVVYGDIGRLLCAINERSQ